MRLAVRQKEVYIDANRVMRRILGYGRQLCFQRNQGNFLLSICQYQQKERQTTDEIQNLTAQQLLVRSH